MRVTNLSGSVFANGLGLRVIRFLDHLCLSSGVHVSYQSLPLWAIVPCSLQFFSLLPEISSSPVLQDWLRSFQVEAPIREVRPPSWDLTTVLTYL